MELYDSIRDRLRYWFLFIHALVRLFIFGMPGFSTVYYSLINRYIVPNMDDNRLSDGRNGETGIVYVWSQSIFGRSGSHHLIVIDLLDEKTEDPIDLDQDKTADQKSIENPDEGDRKRGRRIVFEWTLIRRPDTYYNLDIMIKPTIDSNQPRGASCINLGRHELRRVYAAAIEASRGRAYTWTYTCSRWTEEVGRRLGHHEISVNWNCARSVQRSWRRKCIDCKAMDEGRDGGGECDVFCGCNGMQKACTGD